MDSQALKRKWYAVEGREVPDAAKVALAWARRFYHDAFIGGGFLRDVYHGVEPKDIDVFTFAEEMRPGGEDMLDDERIPRDEFEAIYGADRILFIERAVQLPGVDFPVQVIHLDKLSAVTPAEAVSQFMLGASQVWTEDGEMIFATPAFHEDVRLQRFTVTYAECPHELQRTMQKVVSLQDRYPDHHLAVPARFIPLLNPAWVRPTEEEKLAA